METVEHTHHRISDDNEIPSLCKKTFVSISRAVSVIWIMAVVLILPATIVSIKWAAALAQDQRDQDYKISTVEAKQEQLDKELVAKMNEQGAKIDILLRRGIR